MNIKKYISKTAKVTDHTMINGHLHGMVRIKTKTEDERVLPWNIYRAKWSNFIGLDRKYMYANGRLTLKLYEIQYYL